MEEEDRKRIRLHCVTIVENLRAKDIVSHLFAAKVIDLNEMETCTLGTLTIQDGMLKLVSILLKKKGGFPHFCDAIKDTGSEWLIEVIMKSDVSNEPEESNKILEKLDELNTNEKMNMLQMQLNQQTVFINMLLTNQKSQPNDSLDGREVSVSELPDLKQAMEDHNLSETEVVKYINYLVHRQKNPDTDVTDSGRLVDKRRSISASQVNFTETVAHTTAQDIVNYLAMGEANAGRPSTKYAGTMRRTVSELITSHKPMFEAYVNKIKDSDVTGIDFLFNVAEEIFRDNNYNWGRIAALYAFCGWLAKHDVFAEKDEPRQAIADFLGYYVSQKLGEWIDSHGGWDSFLEQFPEGQKKKDDFWSMALLGLGIGVAAAATFAIASRQ